MLFTNQIQYFQIIITAYFDVSGAVGKNKISYNGFGLGEEAETKT